MTAVKSKIIRKAVAVKTTAPANAIRYKIVTKLNGANEVYEATAEIPGFRATKVTRSDGSTTFTTRSALTKACKDRAASLKRTPFFDFGVAASVNTKKAPCKKPTPKSRKVTTFCATGSVCPVTGAGS